MSLFSLLFFGMTFRYIKYMSFRKKPKEDLHLLLEVPWAEAVLGHIHAGLKSEMG